MSQQGDRYDQVEREAKERQAAARDFGRLLFGPAEAEKTEGGGEGRVASADAGRRTPEEPPREASGIERFRDLILYGPDREPDDAA